MRIMILEDDPVIALDLQMLVEDVGHDVVSMCNSLAKARKSLAVMPDFAILDIDLPDGKSFDIASSLSEERVPFVFVSGSRPEDVPGDLRHAPFVRKPFGGADILTSIPTAP